MTMTYIMRMFELAYKYRTLNSSRVCTTYSFSDFVKKNHHQR